MCVRSLDGETGVCVIRELPPDRDAIEQFLESLPFRIPWCGEAVPSLTQRVFDHLLKADRAQPAASKRAELLAAQGNACNLCGATFHGDLEWDHIAPLHSTCKGIEQVFHGICSACHAEKTALQGRQARSLPSRVSPHVWRDYVTTERPPALAWSPPSHSEDAKLCELDVCRCRRNALLHCPYEFPVLCPFDNIVHAAPGHLADFNFVELAGRGRCSALSLLP